MTVGEYLLKELLLETKDGDWGADSDAGDSKEYRIVRGTDFDTVARGDASAVPQRWLTNASADRRTLEVGDILIETAGGSRDRPTGRTMFVSERVVESLGGPATCASFARFLRPDKSKVYPAYLYWYLQHLYRSGVMEQFQVQHTGVARFQYTTFASTHRLSLPDLVTQHAIAEVLGALDDKIAANTTVVTKADELAVSVYASLPVAEHVPLSSIASFVNGRAYTKGATGNGRVVIRIAELNSGIGGSTVYNDIDVPEDNLARPGDLLFAWSGSLTAKRWYRPEGIVNQHIFKVIPKDGYPLWLVAAALQQKLADFQSIAADKATTMGHIQRHHLDEPVGIPAPDAVAQSDPVMSALWARSLAAEQESLSLATLRDTMLPHLMSGRITVWQAAARVSAAP